MSKIEFRIATAEDAAVVAEISRQTFYDTFQAENTEEDMELFLDNNFSDALVRQELEHQSNTFFLAFTNNSIAGYAKLSEGPPPAAIAEFQCLEIARLYVAKEMIGHGVGAALMEKSIEAARQRNKQIVWLGVWERNLRAIKFYEKWGFKKFDEHVFMVGNDPQNDWLMKKTL